MNYERNTDDPDSGADGRIGAIEPHSTSGRGGIMGVRFRRQWTEAYVKLIGNDQRGRGRRPLSTSVLSLRLY